MLCLLAFVAVHLLYVLGANVTIDDADPSWSYPGGPQGSFGAYSSQSPCIVCQSQPDPQLAFGETWHDCTDEATATLSFTGVSVALYTICPGPHNNGAYSAKLSFKLDGTSNGTFAQSIGGCESYAYNYLVYSVQGLSLGHHTLEVTNHPHDDPLNSSDLLIDYAIVDDGTSPAPQTKKTKNVAAIVVPVIVVLALISVTLTFMYRRRARSRQVLAATTPFDVSPGPRPMDTIAYPWSPAQSSNVFFPSSSSVPSEVASVATPAPIWSTKRDRMVEVHRTDMAAIPPPAYSDP